MIAIHVHVYANTLNQYSYIRLIKVIACIMQCICCRRKKDTHFSRLSTLPSTSGVHCLLFWLQYWEVCARKVVSNIVHWLSFQDILFLWKIAFYITVGRWAKRYSLENSRIFSKNLNLTSILIFLQYNEWYIYLFSADVKCYGNECYPLAFGIPAALMVIATSKFLLFLIL